MKIHNLFLSAFFSLSSVLTAAFAQRDAPVFDSFLSPITVGKPENSEIHASFTLHKTGGPHEHVEHQCYVLLYLKKDEASIRKTVGSEELTDKSLALEESFIAKLEKQNLVVTLESKVAKLVRRSREDGGRGPDAGFPFEFKFKNRVLFDEVTKLSNFDSTNVTVFGKSSLFNDQIGIIAFVPVNDSVYATKVKPDLRATIDFANFTDSKTAVLYFRPLPYSFNFCKRDGEVLIYIN